MKLVRLNCFCTPEKNSGNPAAVVTQFNGTNTDKQHLATQLDLPVTVFINQSTSAQTYLEFYYPARQMPLCLHGTLAAGHVLFSQQQRKTLQIKTADQLLLNLTKINDIIQVEVAARSSSMLSGIEINVDTICKLLGMAQHDLDTRFPLQAASVGSPKLLIPISSLAQLLSLKPNFEGITQWSLDTKINGFYVYCAETLHKQADFHARGFNPKSGHPEDAATGVAAAALSLALTKSLIIEQGHAIQHPSEIITTFENPHSIWVGGVVKNH